MAGHINGIPISYLSLTGSTLGSNQHERDTFWDWMYDDTVSETLRILEMNRVSLESVPFEIVYLKNLHTLSLAENQLVGLFINFSFTFFYVDKYTEFNSIHFYDLLK